MKGEGLKPEPNRCDTFLCTFDFERKLVVTGHGGIFHASMPRVSHASARKLNVSGHGSIFLTHMPRFSYASAGKLVCVDFNNMGDVAFYNCEQSRDLDGGFDPFISSCCDFSFL